MPIITASGVFAAYTRCLSLAAKTQPTLRPTHYYCIGPSDVYFDSDSVLQPGELQKPADPLLLLLRN